MSKKESSTLPSLKKSEIVAGFAKMDSKTYAIVEDKPTFLHDQLMQALYWIWDAFDRASMGMFLVYNTATDAIQNKELRGDRVSVGVRDLEWISGSTPILKAFTEEPIETTDKYVVFKNPFNEVHIYVYIFKSYPCIESTKELLYENEYFKIPNTYRKFIDIFGPTP